jgi:hypothetical protein
MNKIIHKEVIMKSNYLYRPKNAIIIAIALLSWLITACELKVPIKEIVSAKNAIEQAKEVDAEKYSPDEIKAAHELLLQSHDLLAKEKVDEAKAKAEESLAKALEAEKKSLPLYADAHIKAAEKEYQLAEEAYGEKFSPEKFKECASLITEAQELFAQEQFRQAAATADKALALAIAAKNESLSNSDRISSDIQNLKNRHGALSKDEYANAANENLGYALKSIIAANDSLQANNLKSAVDEIANASSELDSADLIITKSKLQAEIDSLRPEITKLSAENDQNVKDIADNAVLKLNSAESALEQNNIEDAKIKIKEAVRLLEDGKIKLKESSLAADIARVESMLKDAEEKDSQNKYGDLIEKSKALIANGKEESKNQQFEKAKANLEEAESIIITVLSSIEKDIAEAKVKAEQEKQESEIARATEDKKEVQTEVEVKEEKKTSGERIYVVQWRKKNTDCLWRISQKVYNDASLWPAIYIANKNQIKDPDLIFPGQKFVIPPKPKKRISYKKILEEEKKAKEGQIKKEEVKENK